MEQSIDPSIDNYIDKPAAKATEKKGIIAPDYFIKALENFSPSHRKEYINWIAEAKTESTRERRMAPAIEQLGEGKRRDWKYLKK